MIDTIASRRGRYLEALVVCAILLLAAVLRLGWAGVNSFAFDEARLSLISLDMAQNGVFARVGMPSSAGVPNLPAAAWIFSLPYVFSTDPQVATQFVGLLSLGMVAGTWALARRVWGRWAGLVALLFIAASPYSALYARSVWAQNLLPVLALGWGWAAFLGAARHSRWAIGLHVFLAGFAFQVHFAGAALAIGTIYCFLRFRWWRHPVPVLIGGGLALLALLPFVVEIACCHPEILDQYRSALGHETRYDLLGFLYTAYLGLGMHWHYLLLGDLHPFDAAPLAIGAGLLLVLGVVSVVKMLVRTYRRAPLHDRSSTGQPSDSAILAEIVLVWLVSAPLFFVRHSTPVFIHYQLVALPALAVLAGAGVRLLISHTTVSVGEGLRPSPTPMRRSAMLMFVPVILAFILALGWAAQIAYSLDVAGRVGTPNGLGTPLQYTRHAAYDLPDDAPALLFTHGDDPDVDGEAAVFEVLWWGRDHRIVQGESLLILPDHPAWLMATLKPFQAWEELDAAGLIDEMMTFPRREGLLPYVAAHYDGVTDPAGFTMLDVPVTLADGTRLVGWKARQVGPRLRISTLWRVIEPPPDGVYQQFHHLYDGADAAEPLAISDVPIAAQDWQVGDRLVVMGDFFVDDVGQQFWVDVGHYTLPGLGRVAQSSGADGLVRLGPFTATDD